MPDLLFMCFELFKTGLFAVGGGLATLPFLVEISEKYPQWFTASELADIVAVSESTPGPIGINMATFVGFKVYGVLGAFLATFSLVLPSFLVILIVAKFLSKYSENKYVQSVFSGLRPAVVGLIAAAGYSVLKIAIFKGALTSVYDILPNLNVGALIIFFVVLLAMHLPVTKKLHPLFYIAGAAVVGIVLQL